MSIIIFGNNPTNSRWYFLGGIKVVFGEKWFESGLKVGIILEFPEKGVQGGVKVGKKFHHFNPTFNQIQSENLPFSYLCEP